MRALAVHDNGLSPYIVPSYTVRYTFPLNLIEYKYIETDKPILLKDKLLDPTKFELFWKQIYKDCQGFTKLKTFTKIPRRLFYIGITLLGIGILLLIIGCIPIWGEKQMSLAMVIVAGVFVVISIGQFVFIKCSIKKYMKNFLYKRYEEAIAKAAHDHLYEFIPLGLHWKGGADGFRCIEFWYIVEEETKQIEEDISIQRAPNNRIDSLGYSETVERIRRETTECEQSINDFRNFFYEPDQNNINNLSIKKRAELAKQRLRHNRINQEVIMISEESKMSTTQDQLKEDESPDFVSPSADSTTNMRTSGRISDSSHIELTLKELDTSPRFIRGKIKGKRNVIPRGSPLKLETSNFDCVPREEEEDVSVKE